ncbi:MAG: polysaccharide deacetylase family protein [Rubripirellula sp.]
MNPLAHAALATKATIVSPFRHARLRRLAVRSKAPLSVLFYHRVANSHPNDWTISRETFRQHIEYCIQNFEMIGLGEVQRRVREMDSCIPAASITFDDGYADNCDFALPLLIQHKVPCTYFVTTDNVRNASPFPHDVSSGTPLRINNWNQIREMSDEGIEIGCHTRTHVDFSRVHDPNVVWREIVESKLEIEQQIGKRVRYFAFPYGMPCQLTQMAIEAVNEAGFDGFCSAYGGYNLVGEDSFHIRRFHGDPQSARLKNWLSFDARKLRQQPEIRYFLPPMQTFQDTFGPASSSACLLSKS